MAYSTAYFLTDFVFLILFLPEEFAYLVHHVVTLIYLASNVYLGFGGISCMALMFTGELTNPLHNVRHVLEEVLKQEKPPAWAARARAVVWPVFNLSYAVIR